MLVEFANAKINIGLQIVEKRSDGFHNLVSCFYPVGWEDTVSIHCIEGVHTTFSSAGLPIPGSSEGNLCLKAYQLLAQDFQLPAVGIELQKKIPIGAGLGGGSADSAYTLRILNTMFSLSLSTWQLENYARQLGSDCAFFIQNKPVLAIEKGDKFEDISLNLNGLHIVIAYPNIHISTQEAYSGVQAQKPLVDLKAALGLPIEQWPLHVTNDFEKSLLPKYPAIAALKDYMYKEGACYSSMTGSGSAVYGIWRQLPSASLLDWLNEKKYYFWSGILR